LLDFAEPTTCFKAAAAVLPPLHDPATGQRVGFLDIDVTLGTAPYTINWTGVTGPATVTAGNDIQGITATAAGSYTINVLDNKGCPATETYLIEPEGIPIIATLSSTPRLSCLTPDGQLSAIVNSAGPLTDEDLSPVNETYLDYIYVWYNGNNETDTTSFAHRGRNINIADVGDYVLIIRDRDDPVGCQIPMTIKVDPGMVNPVVTAGMLTPQTVCDVTQADADGMGFASVENNTIDYYWEWTGRTPLITEIFDKDPVAEGLKSGDTYTVKGIDKVTGCEGTAEVVIEYAPAPALPPNIEILAHVNNCDPNSPDNFDPNNANGALAVSVAGDVTNYRFDWYHEGDPTTIQFTGHIYDGLAPMEYKVIATDLRSFCTSEATARIEFRPVYPEFEIETEPTLCGLTTGAIFLTVTNDVEIASIVWDILEPEEILNYETGPVVQEAQAGLYQVTITPPQNCIVKGTVELKSDVNPYNGISRNGDNLNNYFHINCIEEFPMNVVKIYNRAGTLVFEGEGYNNVSVLFDGESNKGISIMGTTLPDGTYFYVIDKHDGSKPLAGYLEIVN
jgi:large repetitive protein